MLFQSPQTGITATDILAIIGAVTGIVGTIAGLTALGWDVFKWYRGERARLRVEVLPNMSQHILLGVSQDVVVVRITNTGKLTTTLTHLVIVNFKMGFFSRLLRRLGMSKKNDGLFIRQAQIEPLPHVLEPGHEWNALINKDGPEFRKIVQANKKVWVSISHSLSTKSILKPLRCKL